MESIKYGSISTGSKEATESALEILKIKGNAFDAAIAAVFTSMTSEFALTGPFGGGACLGKTKNESPFAYDFFVDCPKITKNTKEFKEISVNFGETIQKFHIGKGSIAIPGNLIGLLTIHKNHGRLPLKEVLKPAINYALNGVVVSKYQAYILKLIEPILCFSNNEMFFKNKKFINEGDTFRNPQFAHFLNIILKHGHEYFYNGDGLNDIFNYLDQDSYLSKNDFKTYKVHKREPISMRLGNHTIYTNPAPAFGGNLIIFLLKLIKESKKPYNIYNLINGMNLTSIARSEICKNSNNEFEINKIFSKNIFNKYLSLFSKNKDFVSGLSGFGSTTHVSILDKEGNAASITTTNGEGCGSIISKYGIMMNNMLGEIDLNPFGFHNWGKKRRLPSMISPTIITKDSILKFVLGSGGSNRIRSANAQVIINLLIHNMNLYESISYPRIHLEGNTLFYEPDVIFSNKKLKNIKLNGFKNKNLFFGGVNAVSNQDAVADERRGGCGIIY